MGVEGGGEGGGGGGEGLWSAECLYSWIVTNTGSFL